MVVVVLSVPDLGQEEEEEEVLAWAVSMEMDPLEAHHQTLAVL